MTEVDEPVLSVKDRLKAFQSAEEAKLEAKSPTKGLAPKLPVRKPSTDTLSKISSTGAVVSQDMVSRSPTSIKSLDLHKSAASPATSEKPSTPDRLLNGTKTSPIAKQNGFTSSNSLIIKPAVSFPSNGNNKTLPSVPLRSPLKPTPRTPDFVVEPPSPVHPLPYQPRINPPRRSTGSSTMTFPPPSVSNRPAPVLPPRKSNSLASSPASGPATISGKAPVLPPRPQNTTAPGSAASSRRGSPTPTTPSTPPIPYSPNFSSSLLTKSPRHQHTESMQSISLSSDGGQADEDGPNRALTQALESSMPNMQTVNIVKPRPIDPRARRRYEKLFDKQIEVMNSSEARLPASVVVQLWSRSGLPKQKLASIWLAESAFVIVDLR